MIRIKETNDDGTVQVSVVDYSRKRDGELEFPFRDIGKEEPIAQYFDNIMNEYWYRSGKNKRRYHEDAP